jgi:hypothetical protein
MEVERTLDIGVNWKDSIYGSTIDEPVIPDRKIDRSKSTQAVGQGRFAIE